MTQEINACKTLAEHRNANSLKTMIEKVCNLSVIQSLRKKLFFDTKKLGKSG